MEGRHSSLYKLRIPVEDPYEKFRKYSDNLQKIQLAILDSVSPLLKEDGELVYSTCSVSVEEDEAVVEQFLKQHPNFELKPFKLSKLESKTGMLKIMPDQDNNDGFFIAKFKMRG